MKNNHLDPNLVIIVDRNYLEADIQCREKGLLDKYGLIDDKTFIALSEEITNHTGGFLAGCYLNVLYRKCKATIKNREKRRHWKTMRLKS